MKIDIIGSVASGKTTLAKEVADRYQVPHYEKDNIVWLRTADGDKKRTAEERDKYFREIISKDNWIVEGSPRDCLNESFECCDYIIVLNTKTHIRLFRVIKRWIKQKCGKEKYNSKPTLKFLYYNIMWVFEFNKMRKTLINDLRKYGKKCLVFDDNKVAYEFIISVYR